MAISPLWPKPPRWADSARHRRSKPALDLAHAASLHPAFVGARQRGRCAALCPSRADAQDGTDVAAEHRRRGDANSLRARCQHSHDRRRRDLGTCRQQSKLRRLGAERALHDHSTDQRPIWWRINQAPVQIRQLEHRRSHPVPYVGHHAQPASRGQWWRHRHHHVVGRNRERYDLVDDRRDMATRTPRTVPGRHLAGQQHRGEHEHQRCVRHLPLGLGLLHQPGLQRRHRHDPVLRRLLDGPHGPPVARRPLRLLRPWNEVPALMGSAPPVTPPRPAPA
jgi:hypothetical protein